MEIRRYTIHDIDTCITLLREFLATSPRHSGKRIDEGKLRSILESNERNIKMFLNVAVSEGSIIGGLFGRIQERTYNRELFAYEEVFFVTPDRRGYGAASKLIKSFIEWAEARGATEVVMASTTGYRLEAYDKLREKAGLKFIGNIYGMEF